MFDVGPEDDPAFPVRYFTGARPFCGNNGPIVKRGFRLGFKSMSTCILCDKFSDSCVRLSVKIKRHEKRREFMRETQTPVERKVNA